MKRAKIPLIILSALIAVAIVLSCLPASMVLAEDKGDKNPDFILVDDDEGYRVYVNSKTKEYKFEETFNWKFWESRKPIPIEYQPTDDGILTTLIQQGIDKNRVHIQRDYSVQYPTTITYREFDTVNFVSLITGLPQVTSDGELIDCKWGRVGDVYISGTNWFEAIVDGTQISVTSDIGNVSWNPQLFLNDVEQKPSKPILLIVDPYNPNYSQNVLEWDYGIVKRRVRLIEGIISERWVVESNPYGEIKIKHNPQGNLSLNLIGMVDVEGNQFGQVIGDEEIVTTEDFNKAVYPVTIGASPLTIYSTADDGTNYAHLQATWDAAYTAANATGSDTGDDDYYIGSWMVGVGNFLCARGYLYFDPSVAFGGTVTGVVAGLYGKGGNEANATHTDVAIVEGLQSTPFDNADYGDHRTQNTLLHAAYYDYSVDWTNVAYNDITFNAGGITVVQTAIDAPADVKFCIRVRGDIGDLDPTGQNQIDIWSSEKGAGFQPRLVITYTQLPAVTSSAATSVEETSATLEGNVTNTGSDATVDQRGFVYDTATHADPGNVAPPATYASSWADAGGPWGTGVFDSGANVVGLTKGELYYFRAYTHNSQGYDYSNTEQTFLTKPDEPTALTATSTGDGEITVAWTTGTGFDQTRIWRKVGSYPVAVGDGVLAYTAAGVTFADGGLVGGDTYYYRAWSWCTEGALERYSDTYAQDNAMALATPTVGTSVTDNVTVTHSATFNGAITSLGGYADATDRGFVWDTASHGDPGAAAPPATYSDSWTESGSFSTGAFFYNITGLTEGQTYYIRACSQNTMGWDYGAEVSFNAFDRVVWYQPNTIISGTTLTDREGNQDAVISWGINDSITITFGAMVSSESTTAVTANVTPGFTMPPAIMPSTWVASGENLANLPFYDSFLSVSTQTGIPVQTMYFWAIIGLALGTALFLIVLTRSAFLGVLAMVLIFFIGSSQTIVPMWIPFSILIVEIAIMFLYRRVAY